MNEYVGIVYGIAQSLTSGDVFVVSLIAPQIQGMEEDIERRTLTYSRWKDFDEVRDRQGWHPVTFNYPDATLQAIKEIQVILSHKFPFLLIDR